MLVLNVLIVTRFRGAGSFVDARNPSAAAGERLFRGSGTSQAAAVVSGGVALLSSAFPQASPDQIRLALVLSGKDVNGTVVDFIRLDRAAERLRTLGAIPFALNLLPTVNGRGSLEAARGGHHLSFNGVELSGEIDIFATPGTAPPPPPPPKPRHRGTTAPSTVRVGLVRVGLVRVGLVRVGLVRRCRPRSGALSLRRRPASFAAVR